MYSDAGTAWPRPQSPAPEPETGNLRPEPERRDTRDNREGERGISFTDLRDVTMSQLHDRLFSIVGDDVGLTSFEMYTKL